MSDTFSDIHGFVTGKCESLPEVRELAACAETTFQWQNSWRVMSLFNVSMVKRAGSSNEMEFGRAAQITSSPGVLDVADLQAINS